MARASKVAVEPERPAGDPKAASSWCAMGSPNQRSGKPPHVLDAAEMPHGEASTTNVRTSPVEGWSGVRATKGSALSLKNARNQAVLRRTDAGRNKLLAARRLGPGARRRAASAPAARAARYWSRNGLMTGLRPA